VKGIGYVINVVENGRNKRNLKMTKYHRGRAKIRKRGRYANE
jgi:hypothetical protein